jgi:hypothetical protein
VGSNPAEVMDLRVIKICSTPSFRGEIKLWAHVVRFYRKNSKDEQRYFEG